MQIFNSIWRRSSAEYRKREDALIVTSIMSVVWVWIEEAWDKNARSRVAWSCAFLPTQIPSYTKPSLAKEALLWVHAEKGREKMWHSTGYGWQKTLYQEVPELWVWWNFSVTSRKLNYYEKVVVELRICWAIRMFDCEIQWTCLCFPMLSEG